MRSKQIYWLASFPRSGSTMLRLMVDYYFKGEISLAKGCYVTTGDNSQEVYDNLSPCHLDGDKPEQYALIRPAAIQHMSCSFQMDREVLTKDVCLKTHYANIPLSGVSPFPPFCTSGALVIVRDPRQVAVSFAEYMGKDIQNGVDSICANDLALVSEGKPPTLVSDWNTWHLSWVNEKQFPVNAVRYEDLVDKPVDYFATVIGLLSDEPVDMDKVEASVKACSFENLQREESETGFISHLGKGKFFRAGKKDSWRDILSKKQEQQIIDRCSQMMEYFKYI